MVCFSSTCEGFILRIAFRSNDFILWITKPINISWTIIQLWKAKVKEYCWLLILWSTNQIFEIILATSFVQFLNIVLTKEHFRWKFQSFYSFQFSVAFYIETSHLFCFAKQMIGFCMKCNTGLKWVKCWGLHCNGLLLWAICYCLQKYSTKYLFLFLFCCLE